MDEIPLNGSKIGWMKRKPSRLSSRFHFKIFSIHSASAFSPFQTRDCDFDFRVKKPFKIQPVPKTKDGDGKTSG